jgi:hypothetical protein
MDLSGVQDHPGLTGAEWIKWKCRDHQGVAGADGSSGGITGISGTSDGNGSSRKCRIKWKSGINGIKVEVQGSSGSAGSSGTSGINGSVEHLDKWIEVVVLDPSGTWVVLDHLDQVLFGSEWWRDHQGQLVLDLRRSAGSSGVAGANSGSSGGAGSSRNIRVNRCRMEHLVKIRLTEHQEVQDEVILDQSGVAGTKVVLMDHLEVQGSVVHLDQKLQMDQVVHLDQVVFLVFWIKWKCWNKCLVLDPSGANGSSGGCWIRVVFLVIMDQVVVEFKWIIWVQGMGQMDHQSAGSEWKSWFKWC